LSASVLRVWAIGGVVGCHNVAVNLTAVVEVFVGMDLCRQRQVCRVLQSVGYVRGPGRHDLIASQAPPPPD
jgi:hypothetical protein